MRPLLNREITNLIDRYLAGNRGPGYGVLVTSIAKELSRIDVTLTFRSGRTYCCAEPFCHVPRDLSTMIAFAAELGIVLPASLTIRWHFVVEEGARLECNKAVGASPSAKHQEFDEVSDARPSE